MLDWKPADKRIKTNKILGYPCLIAKNSVKFTEELDKDLVLPGKYGVIWKFCENEYYVMITSPAIANKHLELEKNDKVKSGEEVGIKVNEEEAKKWAKIIKATRSSEAQLRYMRKICGEKNS